MAKLEEIGCYNIANRAFCAWLVVRSSEYTKKQKTKKKTIELFGTSTIVCGGFAVVQNNASVSLLHHCMYNLSTDCSILFFCRNVRKLCDLSISLMCSMCGCADCSIRHGVTATIGG